MGSRCPGRIGPGELRTATCRGCGEHEKEVGRHGEGEEERERKRRVEESWERCEKIEERIKEGGR